MELEKKLVDLEQLLINLRDYMEKRMDADNGRPNEEMNLYNQLETFLKLTDADFKEIKETCDLLLETTRNLGHPAYGLSSGTTFAIDELREKCFDFLGVPNK